MITDADDKDWEDFWNSMKERVWTTSDLHNIWTTTDLHAVWEEMDQIEPLTPIPEVYRQIPSRY